MKINANGLCLLPISVALATLAGFISSPAAAENPPAFLWARQLGETKANGGTGVAVDRSGNIYVTGRMDFESHRSIGTHVWSRNGGKLFVAKYNPSGSLLWIQKSGGGRNNHAIGSGITVDDFDDVYVTGSFSGKINFNGTTLTSRGELDSLVAKYDADGRLIWIRQAGGTNSYCESYGVATGKNGNIYITGNFVGKAKFGTDELTSKSGVSPGYQSDVFLAKYDNSGNAPWVRQAGEMGENTGHGIAVDDLDNIYVTGRFAQGRGGKLAIRFANFQISESERIRATDTNADCFYNFITKYDRNGNVLWAKPTAGLPLWGTENSIAITKKGQVYLAGSFNFAAKVGDITLTNTTDGNDEIFLIKYDPDGKALWVRSAGGTGHDECFGVAGDEFGNAYIVGNFMDSANFGGIHVQGKPSDSRLGPSSPMFVAKYDSEGDAVWVKTVDKADGYFARAGMVTGSGIAVMRNDDVYVTGGFGGIYAPISFDQFILKPVGNFFTGKGEDIFVAKLGVAGN